MRWMVGVVIGSLLVSDMHVNALDNRTAGSKIIYRPGRASTDGLKVRA